MVWVRSEYAGELAVVLTWLSPLLPWNITYSPGLVGSGSVLFVRFPFLQVRYAWGLPLARGTRLGVPAPGWLAGDLSALAFQRGQAILLAYQVWAVGAAVLLAAVGVAVAYYLREEQVEALPVDPVLLLGGLLGLTGLVLAAATYLLVTRGFPGVPVPAGVVLLLVFGAVLLTAERTD